MFVAFQRACAVLVAVMLTACASGVTRMDSDLKESMPLERNVSSVTLRLSDEAKKLVADNLKFNQETLKGTIERSMNAQNLVQPGSKQTLEVEITSFRVRSAFTAVMFGFMAGNDNVEGVVTLKRADGSVAKKAKVSASYALGGLAGGQDESRMSWLYEEFAKLTVAELTGTPIKK
ncbi:DUF4410 domain-containing protein [Roseateles sp.]|uniref:DUF4410 domain-containing protein n=1 Tax=Roseateles sp. TaxID=1971397 RepID=UPI003265B843